MAKYNLGLLRNPQNLLRFIRSKPFSLLLSHKCTVKFSPGYLTYDIVSDCEWYFFVERLRCQYMDLTSLVAQTVQRLPTVWETWVQSLGQEDLLEKEMVTHSSILVWKTPWTEEPGRLHTSMGLQRVGHDWATSLTHMDLNVLVWDSCFSF